MFENFKFNKKHHRDLAERLYRANGFMSDAAITYCLRNKTPETRLAIRTMFAVKSADEATQIPQ